jgi:hypothetical protein
LNHSERVPVSPACCRAMPVSLSAELTVNDVHCSVNTIAEN